MSVTTVKAVFEDHLPARFANHPEVIKQIGAAYKFIISGDESGVWVVDLSVPGGKITEGEGEAGCVISITDKDFLDLINGELNPQMAFMGGKLKVAGDMGLALKLQSLFS
ncbi:SCP2 sterol-binding domain-containing protein [Myxococcota bacterium]|nr:SCP2 sterol-binding domain-containing protein [Myxococcota bacterium]